MLTISRNPGLQSTLKALVVILMLLLLLIPLSMIRSLVIERKFRAEDAAREIIHSSGGSLELIGPLLVLPYKLSVTEDIDGKAHQFIRREEINFLPVNLDVKGTLEVEYRHRGIYRVPVYSIRIDASGFFTVPDSDIFPDGAIPLKEEYKIVIGIADMRGIRKVSDLTWGTETIVMIPDTGSTLGSGISALIPGNFPLATPGTRTEFSWNMEIGGGGSVSIAPLGRDSELTLTGNWPSPSFQGAVLPDERELDDMGFTARWRIPEVSRPIQPWWDSDKSEDIDPAYFLKVELMDPVSVYARTERSVKYGIIFLLVPFAVFFLFEILGKFRIHPVQYLLSGLADIFFYLLLLSLSEHAGFNIAYMIAATAVILLISFCSRSITRSIQHTFLSSFMAMPAVLSLTYIWLWITLQSEDYALLIGSAGLFLILSMVMILTRKVDWYLTEKN